MPHEQVPFMPSEKLMKAEEIHALAKTFTDLGVDKIRLTGGEPMMRKDFRSILEGLFPLPAKLHITTNAFFLDQHFDFLHNSGMRSVNISLDSLQSENNRSLTQRDGFEKVKSNINMALNAGWHVKLNMVVMKGKNDNEIKDFVELSRSKSVHVRFIEFMPFKGNHWSLEGGLTYNEILSSIENDFKIERISDDPNDTAKNFRVEGAKGTFAIISSVTNPFCDNCNRLRLTADGKLRNCLFSKSESDLLGAMREGKDVKELIHDAVKAKHFARGGHLPFSNEGAADDYENNRSMIEIGG